MADRTRQDRVAEQPQPLDRTRPERLAGGGDRALLLFGGGQARVGVRAEVDDLIDEVDGEVREEAAVDGGGDDLHGGVEVGGGAGALAERGGFNV